METATLNQNTYKFERHKDIMTKINGKEISDMKLKQLNKYKDEIEMYIGIQMGLEDVKAGRVVSEEEAHRILRECIKRH